MKNFIFKYKFSFLNSVVILFFAGCTMLDAPAPGNNKRVRDFPINTQEIIVDKNHYNQSVASYDLGKLRLVPVTRGLASQGEPPEYRLFGILPGTPCDLLSLKNGDILVSANDYVIYDMDKFAYYLSLLTNQSEGMIEIKRAGTPMLVKFQLQN